MSSSIISELEEAINCKSQDRRVETLRRVTDLFLRDVDNFDEGQIKLFDDVLGHLIKTMEVKALAELSVRLAPVENGPKDVLRALARDDQIVVAAPVLSQSVCLSTEDLVDIVKTKSQAHLLAISGRTRLPEQLTDQLLARGDRAVVHKLANNTGARFSQEGFSKLVKSAEGDETLAQKVGLRLDLPPKLLRELLSRATDAVRSWLLSNSPPECAEEVSRVLTAISNEVSREANTRRDYTQAHQTVMALQKRGELTEKSLVAFATGKQYEEMVAALAALSATSIDVIAALMRSERNDGMLIPCKAAGLKWSTVSEILSKRLPHHSLPQETLHRAKSDYLVLSQANAQRTLRFWQVRAKAAQ